MAYDEDPVENKRLEDLRAAETAAAGTNKPSDQVGKGYTPPSREGSAKGAWLSKKRAKLWGTGLLVSLVLGGGGFSIFNIASGPGEFIHFGKLLQQMQFSDDHGLMNNSLGQLWRYARTADNPEQRNLSHWGNKFADHFENKLKDAGITPGYENGRIKTLSIDTKTAAGKKAAQNLLNQGIDADALRPNAAGITVVEIDKRGVGSARFRRIAINGMVSAVGLDKVSASMAARLLKARAGVDFHPLKNIARAADERLRDYFQKRRDERAERIKNGVDTSSKTMSTEANNDPDDPNAANDNNTADATAREANEILGEAADPDATTEERSANIKGKLTAGVGTTAFLATVCGVQALGDIAGDLQQANINLPLIRTGMNVITMGGQMMAGVDVNADEVGAFHDELYDEKTKTSWADAKSIQAELGQKQTGPDMPDSAKPGKDKPAFFVTLDSILGAIPGANGFCGVVTTGPGGWVLSAVGIAAAATGPVSLILNAASEAAQYMLGAAFIDDVVRWLAGEQVDVLPTGALLGNYANYGAKLAANDLSLSHGGRELSTEEKTILGLERRAINGEINKSKSLYARYLDLHETNSVAARLLYQTPELNNPHAATAAIARLPGSLLSNITRPFTNMLFGQARAAEPAYDYGFPTIGFSLDEIDGEGNKNPYERAKIVEPKLAQLNEAYGSCFNMTVDPVSFRLVTQEAKRYDQIDDKCKDPNNNELVQYRFYLVNMTAAKTVACYENIDEEACQEIGFGTPLAGQDSGLIDMANLYEDSSDIACAANTREVTALQDGYHKGELVKIKLCAVPNIPCQNEECVALGGGEALVNARVSGAYYALGEAAKLGGVQLYANSTFRTMAHQQSLCNANAGCRSGSSYAEVAKPGTSNHQMGLAIDFGNAQGNAIARDDQWFDWLAGNAGTYGIKNYPREAWHWSPTGT